MKTSTVLLLTASLLSLAGNAGAIVLDFDTLGSNSFNLIPNGYGGLTWDNMYWVDAVYDYNVYGPSGYLNGMTSANNVAFNGNGDPAVVSNGLFDFNGAFFTGAWNDGLNIDIQGYANSALLYSRTIVVNSTGPTWFQADFAQVDELRFNSYGGVSHGYLSGGMGTHFAMDDMMINEPMNAIPEPSSLLLLGGGLFGLGGVVRRIRRR